MKENDLFLKQVKFKIDNKRISKEDLKNIVKQKPNRKILGVFRFHLGVYNLFSANSEAKIKNNIGEPPVIYDDQLTKKSSDQLHKYFQNKGYFKSKVEHELVQKKNKVLSTYIINTGNPYLIKTVNYQFEDPKLRDYVLYEKNKSLIREGSAYDTDILDKERDRITTILKNRGYYNFNKNYVHYKVDTTIGNEQIHIELQVKNRLTKTKDSTTYENHRAYLINDVNVHLRNKFNHAFSPNTDTLWYRGIKILYDKNARFKAKMIHHAINFKVDDLYQLRDHKATYRHFSALKLYKKINIDFKEVSENKLSTTITLTPKPIKSSIVETVGTNSGGTLGIEGSLTYLNKNLFKGGEHFTIKLKGGLAVQQLINSTENNRDILGLPFNTIEIGPEVSLELPRFLLPAQQWRFSKRALPKTTFKTLFNWQQRPEYERSLAKVSFGYSWNESNTKKHSVSPINISYIKLNLTEAFRAEINNEDNPFITNSYTDHFISSTHYSFIFNNQQLNKARHFNFLKFDFELAGNLLSIYNNLNSSSRDTVFNSFELLNIRYAQFVKGDVDFRDYSLQKNSSFVKRLAIGYGLPYGNLNVLPFEKSYFGGGANGIRAWQARTLGPGSLADSLLTPSAQIGEFKIEANLEYRFDIIKFLEGAVFVDAGNIWLLKPDEKRPNAAIDITKFYDDIAVGIGTGLRLDFSFFIIRFDLAARLKDPATDTPKKWSLNTKSPTLNVGIGYPF